MIEPQETTKLTALVDKQLYEDVMSQLHHGQMTTLLRKCLESFKQKIDSGQIMDIIEFIYKDKPITLGGKDD